MPELKLRPPKKNHLKLTEFGDFFVEMGQGGFERLAVMGIGGTFEVVHNAGPREL